MHMYDCEEESSMCVCVCVCVRVCVQHPVNVQKGICRTTYRNTYTHLSIYI